MKNDARISFCRSNEYCSRLIEWISVWFRNWTGNHNRQNVYLLTVRSPVLNWNNRFASDGDFMLAIGIWWIYVCVCVCVCRLSCVYESEWVRWQKNKRIDARLLFCFVYRYSLSLSHTCAQTNRPAHIHTPNVKAYRHKIDPTQVHGIFP